MTYDPKVGDKVTVAGDDREGYPIACIVTTDKGPLPVHLCACGVFVIAGNNDHLDACPAQMRENAARSPRRVRVGAMVDPEPVPTPTPEPPEGRVVLDAADQAWQRTGLLRSASGERWGAWLSSGSLGCHGWTELNDMYGPLRVLIDPADDAQVRAAGLCRVDEVLGWMNQHTSINWLRIAFRERFGGDGNE